MTHKLSMFNVTLSGAIQRETATATTFDRTESVEKRLVEKLYVIRIRSASLFSVARHFCLFIWLRLQWQTCAWHEIIRTAYDSRN